MSDVIPKPDIWLLCAYANSDDLRECAVALEPGWKCDEDWHYVPVERIAELGSEVEWIPVSERLPPYDSDCLLYYAHGIVAQGSKRTGNYGEPQQAEYAWRARCCGRFGTPTHWMPLPEPPAGESYE